MEIKTLQQCGSCLTRVIKPGLCSYCRMYEDKCDLLLSLAKGILYNKDMEAKEEEIVWRKPCCCSVCGIDPVPRDGKKDKTNYMIFEKDRDICRNCKMKEN